MKKISDENNGYLFTADVLHHGISKTYLVNYLFCRNQIRRLFSPGKPRSIFMDLPIGNTAELK